jgi:hypothetical protein
MKKPAFGPAFLRLVVLWAEITGVKKPAGCRFLFMDTEVV